MPETFDAIVVGARIGGSATALHLAARGWRVLLLDAATFPSDTLSTHLLWSDALRAFDRLGVLGEALATGAPPMTRVRLTFGKLANEAPIPTCDGYPPLLSVRRIVLDDILVRRAGRTPRIELREGCAVDSLLWEGSAVVGVRGRARGDAAGRGSGEPIEARARLVIGADGRHSRVARRVRAAQYDVVPPILATYYAYYRGVAPREEPALEAFRDEGGYCYLFPCDDEVWTVAVSIPQARFDAARRDRQRLIAEQIAGLPALAGRLHGATRVAPLRGAGDLRNFFRTPLGPGWALVGDAGYHRDPITARGIPDALHSAELLAGALNPVLRGDSSWGDALATYQSARDALVKPLYDFTCDRPPTGVAEAAWTTHLARILTDPERLSAYAGFMATVVPPAAFYSDEAVAAGAPTGGRGSRRSPRNPPARVG